MFFLNNINFQAVIAAIIVMLEGVALIVGSILYLIVSFRSLDSTHVICYYFLSVFIALPFAIFLIFSGSVAIYGVKKVNFD